jgi:hypothetical protein
MANAKADNIALFDGAILARAARDSFVKLNPLQLMRNPVIFVTEIVAVMTTVVGIEDIFTHKAAAFPLVIAAWLWLTVLFATFAEAVAEGRGRARAESMKRAMIFNPSPPLICAAAIWCWSKPATSCPPMVKSSKASPASMRVRSLANPHPSSAKPAAIVPPSPAARKSYPTGWWSALPQIPAQPFSTA